MDCSPPGSSVHGILQAGIQAWILQVEEFAWLTDEPLWFKTQNLLLQLVKAEGARGAREGPAGVLFPQLQNNLKDQPHWCLVPHLMGSRLGGETWCYFGNFQLQLNFLSLKPRGSSGLTEGPTAAQAIMKGLSFGGRKSKLAQGRCSHIAQLHQKETFTEESGEKKWSSVPVAWLAIVRPKFRKSLWPLTCIGHSEATIWEVQVVKTETGPALASSCQLREQFSETLQQIMLSHSVWLYLPPEDKVQTFWGKEEGSFIQASSPHGNCSPDSVGPHRVGRIWWDTDLLT